MADVIKPYKRIEDDVCEAARAELLAGLKQCTTYNHHIFKLMYSPKNVDLPLEQVVELVKPEQLSWAIEQIRRTIELNEGGKDG